MDEKPPVPIEGNHLDWRRWVPPDVRKDVISFMIRAFVIGGVVGILCGCLYWRFSLSKEKIFQGAIIVAALAFTMPAFATSLKLMLSMFYMGYAGNEKSEGAFKSIAALKDEAKPILENVSTIVHKMAEVAEKNGSGDMVKALVAEMKAAIPPDLEARFNRLLSAIESIASPVPAPPRKPGLLERGIGTLPASAPPAAPAVMPVPVAAPVVRTSIDPIRPHAEARPDEETRILPMPFKPLEGEPDLRQSGILPKPTMPVGISPIAT